MLATQRMLDGRFAMKEPVNGQDITALASCFVIHTPPGDVALNGLVEIIIALGNTDWSHTVCILYRRRQSQQCDIVDKDPGTVVPMRDDLGNRVDPDEGWVGRFFYVVDPNQDRNGIMVVSVASA